MSMNKINFKQLLATTLFCVFALGVNAQNATQKVSGRVLDDAGQPIVGAAVIVDGTTTGTVTDLDGNYTIMAPADATIKVSFIGYDEILMPVNGKSTLDFTLSDTFTELDELVVVGYGVQKKSVVTASIAKVSSEDMNGKAPVRMENALKGLAAGVNVTSASGQPGSSPKVRIRGVGTINNSDPLYIVDGMPIEGGLDFVNPSDIESIEVLKDAASGAIYGARAANGVVMVTTKKGKEGRVNVNYNFSYGWQSAARRRDVTSATDYAVLQNEMYINGGQEAVYADPYNLVDVNGNKIEGKGTDWQDLVFNDGAPVVNHDVSVAGASERVNYYFSLGSFDQEGIVGGNYDQSNYNRLTLRSNTMYNVMDDSSLRSFLNKLDATINLAYTRVKSTGISENTEFGSVLGSALYMAPVLPVTVSGTAAQNMKDNYVGYELFKDANGNPYTIPGFFGAFQEMNNPLALLAVPPTKNWSYKFVPYFAVDLQIWDNLKYHASYSADMSFWGYDAAVKSKYALSGNNRQEHTSATSSKSQGMVWQIENTLSYDKTIGDHSFNVVLGQSAFKNKSDYLGGSRWNLVNVDKPSIDYATGNYELSYDPDDPSVVTGATVQHSVWGGKNTEHRMSSLFARLSYNFMEKYMVQATVRRDGSSRFGTNNRYGVFPSVSVGWNLLNESFMEPVREYMSNIKIRASWGKNGNDNIGDFRYTTNTTMGSNALFGKNTIKYNGSKSNGLANPDLKWEESEQTNVGVDFGVLGNALTFSVDYYKKKTNGMLMTMPIPSYVGETKPIGNVGDMENSGVEFELGYKWKVSDINFAVKGNATYLKNELINLGNDTGYLDLDGVQGISGGGTRGSNGMPFPYFFGYKTAGVFQNVAEVQAYKNAKGELIMPDAAPGDVRFVDVNGDGTITPDDRTDIGNGTPKWTFGLNFNADWKGVDFNLFLQGVQGADVLDATYRTDVYSGNYPTWMLDRWTGEGTSNKYPILRLGDEKNWQMSDLYVCDGSYLRLKNMSLGYTLPRDLTRKIRVERFRVYVMAENLMTWTKYWGYDPEISSNATSLGVDRGVYPQARTFTVGLNLTL